MCVLLEPIAIKLLTVAPCILTVLVLLGLNRLIELVLYIPNTLMS